VSAPLAPRLIGSLRASGELKNARSNGRSFKSKYGSMPGEAKPWCWFRDSCLPLGCQRSGPGRRRKLNGEGPIRGPQAEQRLMAWRWPGRLGAAIGVILFAAILQPNTIAGQSAPAAQPGTGGQPASGSQAGSAGQATSAPANLSASTDSEVKGWTGFTQMQSSFTALGTVVICT